MKIKKLYICKINGSKTAQLLTGLERDLLQQSGAHVKLFNVKSITKPKQT